MQLYFKPVLFNWKQIPNKYIYINPFSPNAPFLYTVVLMVLEKLRGFHSTGHVGQVGMRR